MTSSTSWLYGENKIQSPITINGAVNTALPVIRSSVFRNRALAQGAIYGTGTLNVPGGTPHSLLDIKRYRPVFHHKDAGRTSGYEEYAASNTAVFQALNGLPVDSRFGNGQNFNKTAFTRQWRCPGLSMTDYNFDLPEQTPSGVAVLISGAADTFNNGPDTWFIGDRLIFQAPELDRERQAAEREIVTHNPGEHRERIEFIIRPAKHVELTLWFEDAMTRFFLENAPRSTFSVDKLIDPLAEGDDGANRAATGFYTFVRQVMLATVMSLLTARVDPSLPGVTWANGRPTEQGLAAYNAVRTRLEKDAIQHISDAGDVAAQQTFLADLSPVLKTWMHLLGLVPTNAMIQAMPESGVLQDQILLMSCPGVVQLKEVYEYFNWSRIIPDVERYHAFEPQRGQLIGIPQRPNTNNIWGALLYTSRASVRATLRGYKDSVLDQLNMYVGTANEITPYGTKGNVRR